MPDTWYKVDNVAKVFLASASARDPRVFRLSCTLNEEIDPALLNEALRQTAREFPQFQVTLHRGVFWHYLESTHEVPEARPEDKAPCAPLYVPRRRNRLLYRVTYFGSRVNLEMFHAVTDGNGGLVYLKAIVQRYLMLRYPDRLGDLPGQDGASAADREQDSYKNFYTGGQAKTPKPIKAYHIRGALLPYDQLQFFEAHLSAKQVLARARALNVTLTSYLGAAMMMAIYEEMPALARKETVTISLPVNLRNYYPSATARNFFSSVYVRYTFAGDEKLATLAPLFDAKLKDQLRPENIRRQMDGYETLEHVPAIRPVPLPIKNWAVNLFTKLEQRQVTAVLSNLGRISLAEELKPYVKGFAAFSSSNRMFTTAGSYGDDLVLGTASAYRSTNVLCRFYRLLTQEGLDVTLYATEVEK